MARRMGGCARAPRFDLLSRRGMNVFQLFTDHVRAAVETLVKAGAFAAPPDLVAHRGRAAARGRATAISRPTRRWRWPRRPASSRAIWPRRSRPSLRKRPEVTKTEIAGPGFINLTLDPAVWRAALADAIRAGADYGRSDIGAGKPVNVEYVSANPTGPMHVGHCRGAVFGDALANLLAFAGFAVTREYYINDAGAQVDALARSALPALPRGAGRGHRRRSRRGSIPATISSRSAQALAAEYGDRLEGNAGERMAAARARQGDRDDDGADPRRPRRAQRQARRVLLRAFADRGPRPGRRHHRGAARAGRGLRRPAAAAEGRADRGLRGSRADAVPRHRLRRRRRPAAEEIRRQLHLFRLRHRLSQVEVRPRLPRHDRRLGRRPRRLRQAHAGGGQGDQRRARPSSTSRSCSSSSSRAPASK